jgi:hypothetical protein
MSGSAVLDTAIGVVFVFLAVSLVCSGVVEWVSNKLNKRGEYLLRGLREMLDIPPGATAPDLPREIGLLDRRNLRATLKRLETAGSQMFAPAAAKPAGAPDPEPPAERPWLADLVLARPLVASLHRPERPAEPGARAWGRLGFWKQDLHLASYLSARTFARGVLDLLVPDATGATTLTDVEGRVQRLGDVPGRDVLLVLIREAKGDLGAFRRSLEQWYDEQMGRVSGWYKRWAQWRLFIVGGLVAVVANVSTVAVAQTFYSDEPVRQAVVAQAQAAQLCPGDATDSLACEKEQLDVLADLSLPVGWNVGRVAADCQDGNDGAGCGWNPVAYASWVGDSLGGTGPDGVLLRLLGWLLTAAAVSFGAPFWFDALSKLGSLRTAGRPPGPAEGS